MTGSWKGVLRTACVACCLASGGAGVAGEPPKLSAEQLAAMEAHQKARAPGPEHAALAATAGTYDIIIRSWRTPGKPPDEETGTATRQMILNGRVLVETMSATLMGQPYAGHEMSGYDNATGEYWTTWMDNNSTGLVVFRGSCDVTNACSLTGGWHDPARRIPVTARMTTRWTSPATQLFEMFGPGKDGKEIKAMEFLYTRK